MEKYEGPQLEQMAPVSRGKVKRSKPEVRELRLVRCTSITVGRGVVV